MVTCLSLVCMLSACQPALQGELLVGFGADQVPPKNAVLILAGSPIDVELVSKKDKGLLDFHWQTHGETLEIERYRFSEKSFELIGAAGEAYEPGIVLLRERFQPGDAWNWSGQSMMQLPGQEPRTDTARKATASIKLVADKLNLSGAHHEALRADVLLSIQDGSPNPVPRKLQFWFVRDRGILKREFAMASTRQPAEPPKPE